MSKFFKKIFVFFLGGILICYIVQYFVDTGLAGYDNDRYANLNMLFRGKINADIVILGSSRAWVQYDPKVIEDSTKLSCYNLGMDDAGMTIIKCWLDSYLAFNKPPKIILLNYEINILEKERRIFNKMNYLPYLNKYPIYSNLEEIDNNILLERIIPMYKYRGLNEQIIIGLESFFGFAKKPINRKYNGFEGKDKKWNDEFYRVKSKLKKIYYSSGSFAYGLKEIKYIMNICRKNNIDLIIVHAPMYFELQQMIVQKDSLDSIIFNITRGKDFHYWKYTADSLNYNKKYYYNAQHLDKTGAEIFSKILARDLKKYILRHEKNSLISNNDCFEIRKTKYKKPANY